ncbi:MAG: homocysteine biosynthesis protein [Deltaproteobacteria bacterium]|nr:homocysteine biosynthesis protein [Deltaproteobacteria bacterium]
MGFERTIEEINEKIRSGKVVVVTAEEIIQMAERDGYDNTFKKVDVVTTGTFGPMCSSGAFINFGHSDPPIKMQKVWLNDVPAYGGIAAVDVYIGATELSETKGFEYGGAHVIEDLISDKPVKLKAISYVTDCYPRREIETYINRKMLNQAYLFNPRNAYQNYVVAVNTSDRTIYTYMGILFPKMANATYCSAGQLSPLINDPFYDTIGIGTKIFLGGAQGFIVWEGTQHAPSVARNERGIPIGGAGTIAVIGDLKTMSRRYIRAAVFERYGVSIYIGLGIPIPILNEKIFKNVLVRDEDIHVPVIDYSVGRRKRPVLGIVNYKQLRSGSITIRGKEIKTAPISSYKMAREIAQELKTWILNGKFFLTNYVHPLPKEQNVKSLDINTIDDLEVEV